MQKSTLHFFLSATALAVTITPFSGDAQNPLKLGERLTFHQKPKPLATDAVTADWPRFLGPTDNCHSPESPLLKDFSAGAPTLVWEVARGTSHTSPVVVDDRLVFIHVLDNREVIECRHPETGQMIWIKDYPVELGQSYGTFETTRCSPVIDALSGLVFTLGVKGNLMATELHDGNTLWEKDLATEFGDAAFFFGYGGSPLVYDDKLIVNTGSDSAGVVAIKKTTGRELWRAPSGWNGSYSSPVVGSVNGEPRIFTMAAGMADPPHGGLLCLHPVSGQIDSRVDWRSTNFASIIGATPVPVGNNRIFITEGYGRGGAMIEFDEKFEADIAWRAPRFDAHFQTAVFHDDHLYGFTGSSDPGAELVCYEAESGDEKWREGFGKLNTNLGRTHLLRADGAFWCVGSAGVLLKLDLSPDSAQAIDNVELFRAPETWGLPALSKGLLYVPENGATPKLRCYDLRGE